MIDRELYRWEVSARTEYLFAKYILVKYNRQIASVIDQEHYGVRATWYRPYQEEKFSSIDEAKHWCEMMVATGAY